MNLNSGIQKVNLQTNNNLNMDKGSFIIIYSKYKDFVLPLVILVISFIILFVIVIPEINQYSASRQELNVETQKLNVLTNNYNFLTDIDELQSESNLRLLTKTFPVDKDFVGIMTAVSAASSKTGVSLVDFKFSLGNLSKALPLAGVKFPTIQMELKTEGNAILLNSFVNELYRTVPLIEVSSIKHKDDKATVILQFYYKPFPPQNISDENPISRFSVKEQSLIKDLYTWNNLLVENGLIVSEAQLSSSSSASVNITSSQSSTVNFSPF